MQHWYESKLGAFHVCIKKMKYVLPNTVSGENNLARKIVWAISRASLCCQCQHPEAAVGSGEEQPLLSIPP
jgi:hypothetical protein